MRRAFPLALLLTAIALLGESSPPQAVAQGAFDPFAEREPERAPDRPRSAPPDSGQPAPQRIPSAPVDEGGRAVERAELAPIMAGDGSGLPYELWQGVPISEVETLLAGLELPPRSTVLRALWQRMITSDGPAPSGGKDSSKFVALRVEALDRSGLIDAAADLIARQQDAASDPVLAALLARNEIGLGNPDRGCEIVRSLDIARADLPRAVKGEAILITGYCAARSGDMTKAALAAELARELGDETSAAPDILAGVAGGGPAAVAGARSPLDYRILELGPEFDRRTLLPAASPALLVTLARAQGTDDGVRIEAGERAVGLNALTALELAALYRGSGAGEEGPLKRALLFKSAEGERSPLKKARLVQEYLDEAKRAGFAGFHWAALALMAAPVHQLEPRDEIGWFAQTAAEVCLAAGAFDAARRWALLGNGLDQGRGQLGHWIALADIADPALTGARGAHLDSVEQLALSGRFEPALLHRLATVLDALDINVPVQLWDLASRAAQPAGGHLPETGALSQLAEAAKSKQFARTVLLVMQALGPQGLEGAHLIALGDSIRALKRAGFEADARRLGLEALMADWPRVVSN